MTPDPIAFLRALCTHAAVCCRPGAWGVVVAVSVAWIAALGLAAALLRTAWLGVNLHRKLARLAQQPVPAHLADAAARAGLRRHAYLPDPRPHAFCAGFFHPRVYLTAGLLVSLHGAALDAVLVHESEHARRRDPLRRAFGLALSEVFFFLPVMRWLANHLCEDSEMQADRAAMRRLGRPALAAALLALDDRASLSAMPAFTGIAELRVAQLLGDPLPRRLPAAWQWTVSALGLAGAVYLAFCPTGGLLPR
jgi:Zn-dependent protease with chaperone function